MFPYAKAALLPLIAIVSIQVACAQATPDGSARRPDPADQNSAVPPVVFQSAFGDYQRFGADKLTSWRAANDEVAQIGGWRVYAKEARGFDAVSGKPAAAPAGTALGNPGTASVAPPPGNPVSPATQEPAKPTPSGHAGHSMK